MTLIVVLILVSVIRAGAVSPRPTAAQADELVIWDDHYIDYAPLVSAFEAKYGIKVRVEIKPWQELRDTYADLAQKGEGPDLFTGADDWLWRYLPDGLIEPIDLGPRANDFMPYALSALTHDGKLYGIPYAIENTALVRNTDLVPDPPQTWKDVAQISRALVEAGRVKVGFGLPDQDWYFTSSIQSAFGGYAFGQRPDGTFDPHDIGLNNPGAVAGIEWIRQMTQAKLLSSGLDWEQTHAAFAAGDIGMMLTQPSEVWQFAEAGTPYAVSPIPAGTMPGRPWIHTQAFMINARSPHKKEALTLLMDYLATEPALRQMSANRWLSPSLPVFETTEDPVLLGFADALMTGQRYPNIGEMEIVWQVYPGAVWQARLGEMETQPALDQAVETIRGQIK
jgi:maltose-binding protein MalE